MSSDDENICLICKDTCDNSLSCGHYYHKTCLSTWFVENLSYKCLYCFKNICYSEIGNYINYDKIIITEYETNLNLVKYMYIKKSHIFNNQFYIKLIRVNNIAVITALETLTVKYDYLNAFMVACDYNNLELIKYFDDINNNNISEDTITDMLYNSIMNDNLQTFDYIVTNYTYCRKNNIFTQYAVLYNNLSMLKHLLNADFVITNCLLSKAITKDSLEMVKFLYNLNNNYRFTQTDRVRVASHGSVEVLEYLGEIVPDIFNFHLNKISVKEMNIIIRTCSGNMFKFLYNINILCSNSILANSCFNQEHNYIIYKLYNYGCEFSSECFENICLLNLHCMVEIILNKLDLPQCMLNKLINIAYEYNRIEIIFILQKNGYIMA